MLTFTLRAIVAKKTSSNLTNKHNPIWEMFCVHFKGVAFTMERVIPFPPWER